MSGHGRYIDDIKLPRMLHACFVRSPHPHARIRAIDIERREQAAGVVAVFTAADLNPLCEPFVGAALHRPGHRSPPQALMAAERAVWQGQTVVAVVAESRAEAEDAAELVAIEWEELPAVADPEQALASGATAIHPELGDNVAFDFSLEKGEPAKAFAEADLVIEEEFRFERQMAMTLEPRGLIADFNRADGSLTVIHSHQSPFQMQDVFSRHLRIPEHKVRVIAPDIGGGFGMKINPYTDEVAVAAASMLLGRPVKFCVDRLESFVSDAHSRDHRIKARIALKNSGEITAMELDDIGAVGAYGMPLRFNVAEGMMAITVAGAPYSFENYKARTRSVYVNKNLIGMYRGVGMPLACVVTELLTDFAADRARHRHGRVQATQLPAEVIAAVRDAGRPAARNRLVPRMPGEARRAHRTTKRLRKEQERAAQKGSTAASGSARSSSRRPTARPTTVPRARRSRRRTAARFGSNLRAPSAASPA